MDTSQENSFDQALARYRDGADPLDLINDFEIITKSSPNLSAGWTCLAWLRLLCDQNDEALHDAKIAVKLNAQDPQARINLSLALLETDSKGVRDHIEFVKKALFLAPEFEKELKLSIEDGLKRKADWHALKKIRKWLEL